MKNVTVAFYKVVAVSLDMLEVVLINIVTDLAITLPVQDYLGDFIIVTRSN